MSLLLPLNLILKAHLFLKAYPPQPFLHFRLSPWCRNTLCPPTYEICLWNCSSALESVATEIKRYKSGIGIGILILWVVVCLFFQFDILSEQEHTHKVQNMNYYSKRPCKNFRQIFLLYL